MNDLRKFLATVTVVFCASATPAFADSGTVFDGSGAVTAGYNVINNGSYSYTNSNGSNFSGTEDGKVSGLEVNLRASVSIPLSSTFGAQLDGNLSRTVYKPDANLCSDCAATIASESVMTSHVFWRKSGKGLVGLVGQRTTQNTNFGTGQSTYYVGAEGQIYAGKATLYGQVTYAANDQYGFDGTTGVNAAVQVRFFPTDNLKFTLKGGYEKLNQSYVDSFGNDRSFGNNYKTWLVGGSAEYRLKHSRFSLVADVDYRDLKQENYFRSGNFSENSDSAFSGFRAMVGFKVTFGTASLIERDRSGASLDPVTSLLSEQASNRGV